MVCVRMRHSEPVLDFACLPTCVRGSGPVSNCAVATSAVRQAATQTGLLPAHAANSVGRPAAAIRRQCVECQQLRPDVRQRRDCDTRKPWSKLSAMRTFLRWLRQGATWPQRLQAVSNLVLAAFALVLVIDRLLPHQ